MLIALVHESAAPMEKLDRECIIEFLDKWETPPKPKSTILLMKTFFTSCFTYAPLRKYLSSVAGHILSPDCLPNCLAKIYSEKSFLHEHNWYPQEIYKIAGRIQQKEQFDLKSKQYKPRMIRVLLDGSKEMEQRLNHGINGFLKELDKTNEQSGAEIWKYVLEFQSNIYNVGTALICDFIKNIGYDRFVKVDHHFKKEFPELMGYQSCKTLSPKEHFILSQEIADLLNMSPFHLDHLLYQWGRYKKLAGLNH